MQVINSDKCYEETGYCESKRNKDPSDVWMEGGHEGMAFEQI